MNGVSAWAVLLFMVLMACFTSASVGGLVSMLRSSGAGGGGSGLHRSVQPICRPVHIRL